jgi:hypothetical protein
VSDPSEESLVSNDPGRVSERGTGRGSRYGLILGVLWIRDVPEPDSKYVLDGDG